MMEIIDDLVILGLAVPEEIGDGRRTVCLGGYSKSRGFIRVYPCRPDMKLSRWDIIRVHVERNPRDNRDESWKFVGSNVEWEQLNRYVEKVGRIKTAIDKRTLLDSVVSDCVQEINDRHGSLGVIKASVIHRAYFDKNPQYGNMIQNQMFIRPGEWVKPKRDYPIEPRLDYSCGQCMTRAGRHNQKILEWGAFEWVRKNPGNPEQYWENMGLYSPERDIYLHVGNQANQRTSFMVINVIPLKRDTGKPLSGARAAQQLPLFDLREAS